MSLDDMLAQFDLLGWAVLLGSLLFLAGLVWLLVENRSFEAFATPHTSADDRGNLPRAEEGSSSTKNAVVEGESAKGHAEPRPHRRPGRAA